jgi:hypothetical protein
MGRGEDRERTAGRGHLIAMLEIIAGMFGLAVITGLIFVIFSRPTARNHFSKVAVIAPFEGVPNLMIRVANLRHQPYGCPVAENLPESSRRADSLH